VEWWRGGQVERWRGGEVKGEGWRDGAVESSSSSYVYIYILDTSPFKSAWRPPRFTDIFHLSQQV